MSYSTLAVGIDDAVTTLASSYVAGSGTMNFATGTRSSFISPTFGTPTSNNPVRIYVINENTNAVAIYFITALSGDSATVAIADGTTDINFPAGATVSANAGSGFSNDLKNYVQQLQTNSTNASNLTSGTVPTAQLGSGTASSSTFLRGDSTWASGLSGPQGFQGVAGLQGSQGSTGLQGQAGTQGFQGFQGATGTGSQGYQGFQGNQGSGGLQGNQGATGTGSQGAQGSAGASGTQGPQGRQGFQGFQGSSGTGSQGFQGFQGQAGTQGYQGSTGPQGSGSSPGGSSGTIQYNSSGSLAGATGLNYNATGTNMKIVPQHTGDVALGVQGIASQTGNSLEIRNASGGLGTSIDVYGNLTVNGTSGTFNEVTSTIGISIGLADSARILFADGTSSQNWQIDNYGGTFRWFTPGVTRMSLSGSGGGLTVPGSVNVTSTSAYNNLATYTDSSTGNLVASVGPEGQITTTAGLTVAQKVGIGTTNPAVGLHQAGGGYYLQAIIPPIPTITQAGTAGSTQWYYWIVVKDRAGNYTGLSTEGLTTTSNATLGTSNYNVITFNRVDGAYEYFVIRAFSNGLDPGWYIGNNAMIGSVFDDGVSSSYSINDQIPGDPYIFSGPISVANQTANAQIDGNLYLGAGNDEASLVINATNASQNNFDALQVNGAYGNQCGIDQNACIRTATTTGMPGYSPPDIGAMAYDPNTGNLWIQANAGWIALEPPVGGAANNPPDLSTFTAYGYAIAATGQSFSYFNEISPACTYVEYTSLNAGSHQPAAWVIPIPTGSSRWTAIAQIQGNVGPGWAASMGLCMLESSTGKMVTWGPIYNYGTYACNSWGLTANKPGTGVGGSYGSGVYSATQTYEAQWLKLVYNTDNSSTQVEAYISTDGRNFTHVTSLYFSGNFTTAPDSIGIGGDVYVGFSNDASNRGGWSVFNWSFTSSL